MSSIKKDWWKWLGVLILTLVILIGLLVPLNPGITQVSPSNAASGTTVSVSANGYNTFFTSAKSIRAWLKLAGDHALAAKSQEIISDNEIIFTFDLPQYLPVEQLYAETALVIDSDIDGAFVRPFALSINQKEVNVELGEQAWSVDKIHELTETNHFRYPFRNILVETIRNTYFHVPLWFGMILLFLGSVIHSIKFLRKPDELSDQKAVGFVSAGVLFGIMGLVTGAIWAKFTWGAFWSWDVKQNMSAICMLIYAAYFVLRQSMTDQDRRARVSAVYNLFAFMAMIPLLFVIPRLTESLHPGNGGNPALGGEDLGNTMRMIFYPAIIGWTLLGVWMAQLKWRTLRIESRLRE